jgi:NAD(P)-dependent dehydrogenase (short-subunit alcohol dehydrogenase family)
MMECHASSKLPVITILSIPNRRGLSAVTRSVLPAAADVADDFVRDTPMPPLAELDEIARIIIFLASDAPGHVTGTSISARGGSMRPLA